MISIIIPTLNEASVIEKTLKNLSLYTGKKEIIISDGKSTDETIAIAKKYADQVLVYKGTTRQTIGGGRNMGAAVAHGEYLLFLDADMWIPEPNTFFPKAIELFEKNKKLTGLVVSIRVFPDMETLGDKIVFGSLDIMYRFYNNVLKIGAAGGEFQMIKSEAFKKLGGFNEELAAGEDHEFFRRVAKLGETHLEKTLHTFQTGRRAHKIGWPRLLYRWSMDGLYVLLFKRAKSKEWTVIR